jgi:hypothetical protein
VPDPAGQQSPEAAIVAQVLRADGTAANLSKSPRSTAAASGLPVTFASDGTIWAFAAVPPAMSRDSGRTWQKVGMPKLADDESGLVDTADGKHLYAITGSSQGVSGLWASDDGGKKWRKLTLPSSESSSSGDQGVTFSVVPDGSFLMQHAGILYTYKVGSSTAAEVPLPGVEFTVISPVHGGVIAVSGDGAAASYYYSVNGGDWMRITLRVAG